MSYSKHSRTIFITMLCTLCSFGSICYTSCKGSKCKNINCLNGGTCSNGICSCPGGSSGTLCEINDAANFVGIWLHDTTISSITVTMAYKLDAGAQPGEVIDAITIGNDSNCHKTIKFAGHASGNKIVFGPEQLTDSCGNSYYYHRTGAINSGIMTFCYITATDTMCKNFHKKP